MSSKFTYLVIFVCLFLIPLVHGVSSSEDLEYIFQAGNSSSSISRPCFNVGTPNGWCSNAAICQITVSNPAGQIVVAGGNMTNQVSFHNYTLPILNDIGVYKVDMACNDNNLTGYDTFFFGVNKDVGASYTNNDSVLFILGVLIVFFVIFSFASYFTEEALKMVFLLLAVLMVPIILWVTLEIAKNSYVGASLVAVISTGFYVSLICFVGMVFYVLLKLLMGLRIKKTMEIPKQQASPAYWQKKEQYKQTHKGEEYQ